MDNKVDNKEGNKEDNQAKEERKEDKAKEDSKEDKAKEANKEDKAKEANKKDKAKEGNQKKTGEKDMLAMICRIKGLAQDRIVPFPMIQRHGRYMTPPNSEGIDQEVKEESKMTLGQMLREDQQLQRLPQ